MQGTFSFLDGGVCYLIKYSTVDKRILFKSDDDYKFYLYLLKKYKARFRIKLFAFCLTPKGVSLIAQPCDEAGLTIFLHHLSEVYLDYFNDKNDEFEPLKAGRCRKLVLEDDQTLISCIKEMEFLPVKQLLSDTPLEYPYSSYCSRIVSHQNGLLDRYFYAKSN